MDIGIKVSCQIAPGFVPLDTANDHDRFARFFTEYPVNMEFVVRVGQENLVDYLGLALDMNNKN